MELRRGIRQVKLLPYFQSIVSMPERCFVGFEVPLRWQQPSQGLLLLSEFVAVDRGLNVKIDLLIPHAASRIMDEWKRRIPELSLRLPVNVSCVRPHLRQSCPDCARGRGLLEAAGLNADELYLEINETILVEDIETTTVRRPGIGCCASCSPLVIISRGSCTARGGPGAQHLSVVDVGSFRHC